MTISFFFGLLLAFCLSPGLCSEPWSPPELGDTTDLQQLHLNDELRNEWDHVPFQSRVVGGSVANGENYPWHVNLGGCGGTLVHEDIILTAAHCKTLYPFTARIGGSTRNSGIQAAIDGDGTEHPSYNSRGQDYDFMLYKLKSPVTSVTPVILNRDVDNPSGIDVLTVIGFGSTFEGGTGSFDLREVDVNFVPHVDCVRVYGGGVEEDSMLCAGVNGGGRDSCQGDSGGPILDKAGIQVGVTSWGNGCAQAGFPGVYARVSSVSAWIDDTICEMSDNPSLASCQGNGSGNNDGAGDENGNDDINGSNSNNDIPNPIIQPRGVSLRVDITYDQCPEESSWLLYDALSNEELYWLDFGEVTSPGLHSKTFPNLAPGTYNFLMLDSAWDGVCCRYGAGKIMIYEAFSEESGRDDELRWQHSGQFWNAAGSSFSVVDNSRRELKGSGIEVVQLDLEHSPYVPQK